VADWGLPRRDGSYAQAMLPAGRYDVAAAEARQGRRGLLDSGPHDPRDRERVRPVAVEPSERDELYAAHEDEARRRGDRR
jgi:hypothetical protein